VGRADQSLAQVKGVSCGVGWRIWSLFPGFLSPAVPGGFPASPGIPGRRRRWMSCATQPRRGASPRTTMAMVPTTMSTSLGAGSSSCLTRQVGCSGGLRHPAWPPRVPASLVLCPLTCHPCAVPLLGPPWSCAVGQAGGNASLQPGQEGGQSFTDTEQWHAQPWHLFCC